MLRRFGFLSIAALLFAIPAAAQDERPIKLTIGGGFTGMYGAASDHIGNGGNFTLGVLYQTKSIVGVQAEYAWNGIKQKQLSLPVFPSQIPGNGGGVPTNFFADGNIQYGDVNLLLSPKTKGKAKPYVITGLGVYYRPAVVTSPAVGYTTVCDPYWYVCYPTLVTVDKVVGSRSSTDFGMNIGGGLNFKMGERASIYFEIRYHYVWGPSISQSNVPTQPIVGATVPTSLKANAQFMPITVGFRF